MRFARQHPYYGWLFLEPQDYRQVYNQLIDMRDKGAAILLVSVELEEVLSLSDRIIVMFDGNIVGEKINKDVTDRELGLLMAGVA